MPNNNSEMQKIETGLSSVKISKKSTGVNFEIKVYDEKPEKAEQKANQIYKRLEKKYGSSC
ncbi:MAG: hypothetical protein ACLFUH_00930 [Bacteroidales bacterium]